MAEVGSKRILSIQSLRGLSIIIIFIAHTGMLFNWSELGVSVFFVMSGFLMMYTSVGGKQKLYHNRQYKVFI